MARGSKGGRPVEADSRGATQNVRVFEDLFWMIHWIKQVTGEGNAEYLDPKIRPSVRSDFERHRVVIEAMLKARGWTNFYTPPETTPTADKPKSRPRRKKPAE